MLAFSFEKDIDIPAHYPTFLLAPFPLKQENQPHQFKHFPTSLIELKIFFYWQPDPEHFQKLILNSKSLF